MGGGILAISVDTPQQSRRVVDKQHLAFPILADVDRKVIRAYGVLHPGGSPGGQDIALPSQFLIGRDGRIAWSVVAHHAQERPHPTEIIKQIRALEAR